MRDPIIKYNFDDFESPYDILSNLRYKGELFSGTLIDEDNKSYTEYLNGNAHGQSVEYYPNGKVQAEYIFEDGFGIEEREWYPDGTLRSDGINLYNQEGRLIRTNTTWFYPNGQKINTDDDDTYCLFSSQGQLAIKTKINMIGNFKNTVVYYDKVLSKCYVELFTNHYPEVPEANAISNYILWGWAMRKYSLDNVAGLNLFIELTNHPNKDIAETAHVLLNKLKRGEIVAEEYFENIGYNSIIDDNNVY